MRKLLRNQRGVAMEMAITTMLIIFALCTVLLIVAEYSGVLNARTSETANVRIMVDRLGEDFYRSHKLNVQFDPARYSSVYTATVQDVDEQTQRLLVYNIGKYSTPLLCVEVTGQGEGARVVRWSYNYSPSGGGESGD